MSAEALMAALEAPDVFLSHKQLQSLVSETPVFTTSLPETAVAYLHAFCSHMHLPTKRRWIGLCLRNMLMVSPVIVKRLAHLDPGLAQIGDVVLNASESEDTRIVAGLIVRQGLAQNMTLQDFWKNGALLNLVTAFPHSTSRSWMKEFKSFVEVLHELLFKQEMTSPHVHHPLSLAISGKVDWPGETRPFVSVQADFITIIGLGADARHVEFIDVPLQHIASMSDQQSTPQDDRGLKRRSAPWNIILEFKPKDWAYRINLSEHNEADLVITFMEKVEAQAFIDDLNQFTGLLSRGKTLPSRTAPDDAFGFPEQSTRIIRPKNLRNKTTPMAPSHTKIACQKDNNSFTTVRPTVPSPETQHRSNAPLEKTRPSEDHESKLQPKCKAKGTLAYAEKKTSNIKNQRSGPEERSEQNAQPSAQGHQVRTGTCSTVTQLESLSEICAPQEVGEASRLLSFKRRMPGLLLKQEQSQRIQPALVGQESAPPAADCDLAGLVAHLQSPDMRSETGILQKLNAETNDENDNIALRSPSPAHNLVLGKRPFGARIPSTPPSKRVRREGGQGLEQTCSASVAVPPTTKRNRVLEDPSSPCGQRKRPSVTLPQGSTRDKQSPFPMKANITSPRTNVDGCSFEPDQRQTPVPHTKRGHSGESNIELLSSNSKRTPASPHAESTAISGHADPRRVNMEKEMADNEIRRTDPFKETALRKIKATTFTRKLSRAMSSSELSNEKWKERAKSDTCFDGDTLVEHDEDPLPTNKRTPAHLCSSPPPLYHDSPSTPGSSSLVEAEPKTSTPVSASDVEATEWEANLQSHQRTLHDRLFRVSNRVMRYIVDNETIIEDISETYHHDGESLLQSLVDRHSTEIDDLSAEMDNKADKMKHSCDHLLKQLAHDRKTVLGITSEK